MSVNESVLRPIGLVLTLGVTFFAWSDGHLWWAIGGLAIAAHTAAGIVSDVRKRLRRSNG